MLLDDLNFRRGTKQTFLPTEDRVDRAYIKGDIVERSYRDKLMCEERESVIDT